MSYEQNKSDFQCALDNMANEISQLDGVLTRELLEVFEKVQDEYYDHFEPDIVAMYDKLNELEERQDGA